MQGWVRTSRFLSLVEHSGSHAFFVFVSSAIPPIAPDELTLERILPLNSNFKCEIGTLVARRLEMGHVNVSRCCRR